MTDLETCEWPFPQCPESATGRMTYSVGSKALCGPHFRDVEGILWARGLTWTAEPMGLSRKLLALRHRADAADLGNRDFPPA